MLQTSTSEIPVLEIDGLVATVEGKTILNGISLKILPGQIHAIMGPNGAGKSTLAKILAGHPGYEISSGSISLSGEELNNLEPEVRAHKGLFMGFQYPVEVPGVSNKQFLQLSLNAKRKAQGMPLLDDASFNKLLSDKMKVMDIREEFAERSVNEGFSGGEKKRNEILQMAVLDPKIAILDETDSGLDIDAMRIVAAGVNTLRNKENALLLITHYQRLLDYIKPDFVHVMIDGRIVLSGGPELALELEEKGYDWITPESSDPHTASK